MTGSPGAELEIARIRHDDPRFAAVASIRTKVFMEEQNTSHEEEWDDKDALCTHYLAYVDGAPAGTLRWWNDEGWFHIGRLAVLQEFRGRGIARRLVAECIEEARRQGFERSFLNSQVDKQGFYRAFGFESVGAEFYDGPVLHRRMEAALKNISV